MTAPNGGGSLLVAWQLKDKNVLIVGGGEVGAQRINSILTTDAHITLIAPTEGLSARAKSLLKDYPASTNRLTHISRTFAGPSDLDEADMVLTALNDNDLSQTIVEMCRERRIPVNAADIPELCDFYFGAQIRDGPLQIMISTNGNGPKMAALIKDRLKSALTGKEGRTLVKVGQLRAKLKERAPGVGGALGKKRMRWMSKICEEWSLDALAALDEETMEKLLNEGWEKNRVPPPVFFRPSFWQQLSDWTARPIATLGMGLIGGLCIGVVLTTCFRSQWRC